jgi:hypothetical protein
MGSVWSREFVREILNREDALGAIYALAEIWSSRPGRLLSHRHFGLLPCEFNAHLFLNYVGNVGNGGHAQFFLNPVGAFANETLDALNELGFIEIGEILSNAISLFPNGLVPRDCQERGVMIQSFPPIAFTRWDQMDKRLDGISGNYWQPLLKYLRDHEVEILAWECD